MGRGRSTREIGEALELSVKTVESYREKLNAKLGTKSGGELIRHAVAWVLSLG